MKVQTIFWLLASLFVIANTSASAAEPTQAGQMIHHSRTFHKTVGWEKQLVNQTPNLKNFYWTPITSVSNAYRKAPLPGRNSHDLAKNVAPIGSRYKKMGHVPLPNHPNANQDVSARIRTAPHDTDVKATVLASYQPPAAIASYGSSYKSQEGHTFASLGSTEVRGRLLHK